MAKNWKNERALVTEGGFNSGFWTWSLDIDLEELQAGAGDDAISIEQHHDNEGRSWSEYHCIVRSYKLPDGAKREAVEAIVADIVKRAGELTEGFSVAWKGSNRVARWADTAEAVTAYEKLSCELTEKIAGLECLFHYDLSSSDHEESVFQAVTGEFGLGPDANTLDPETLKEKILEFLDEIYCEQDFFYTGHADAAEAIAKRILTPVEDAGDSDNIL